MFGGFTTCLGSLPSHKQLRVYGFQVRQHLIATLVSLDLEVVALIEAMDEPVTCFECAKKNCG
jgi:hypothetical protein